MPIYQPCRRKTQQTIRREAASGFILLQVLFFIGILNLAVFVLFIVALRTTQIQQFRDIHRHTYWLARSEAALIITKWNQGIPPVMPISRTVPGGRVQVTSTTSAGLCQVNVVSTWGGGMDTVQFAYDPTTHQVTAWMDDFSPS